MNKILKSNECNNKIVSTCISAINNLLATNKIKNFDLNIYDVGEYLNYLIDAYGEKFYNGELAIDLSMLEDEATYYLKYLSEKEIEKFDEERLYKLNEMKEDILIDE